MTGRILFLDHGPGETRGVIALNGRPERLIIERQDRADGQALGSRHVARVRRIERGLATAFLGLTDGPDAAVPATGLTEGQVLEIEIVAEARAEKGPVARVLGPAQGPPRLLEGPMPLSERLRGLVPGASLIDGPEARRMADAAQDAVLSLEHPLPGGGSIAIETTRALTAIDVDMAAKGGGDARRAARQVNLAAITEGARLLRLKGIGGLVVFDLVGKGHDGAAMAAAAKAAFAPDGAGVSIGPISRFGLFELSLPHTVRPVAEWLLDADGRLSAVTAALSLARRIDEEGRANPGARLDIAAAADVIEALSRYMPQIVHQLGDRVQIRSAPGIPRTAYEIAAR